jgi:hypothetical protein
VFLTVEPLVEEPSQEEKAICNLKTNKAPGEEDIIAAHQKRKPGTKRDALICKIWRYKRTPDEWKVGFIVPIFKATK